jgi:predicted transposase/invertase (TIGR01784 family)
MWDSVAKNLLINNVDVRNSILTCLSGVVVTESQVLDLNLFDKKSGLDIANSFKALDPKEFFELQKFFEFEVIAKKRTDVTQDEIDKDKIRLEILEKVKNDSFDYKKGSEIIKTIFDNHELICELFPTKHPHSVDFLCKTDRDQIITIEFQVAHQPFFDKRALHYLCTIFTRQKKTKDKKYENVHPVIAVNVLAAEQTPMYRGDLIKYWSLTDQISKETLPHLTLIQYNLFKIKENFENFWSKTPYQEKEKIDPKMIMEWLEFFSEAHKLRESHQSHFAAINKAYEAVEVERADMDNPDIAEVIQVQKEFYENLDFFKAEMEERILEKVTEKVKEEGLKEGEQKTLLKMVKKFLNQNKTDEEICDLLDMDQTKLQGIKGNLHQD